MLDNPPDDREAAAQGSLVQAHLLAQLRLLVQAAVCQALVEVAAKAGLKHQVDVGGIISSATQVHHARHPAAGACLVTVVWPDAPIRWARIDMTGGLGC